jgi:lipoate-protein ligase A
MWKVVESKNKSAEELMGLDQTFLLEMGENDPPLVHFYDFIQPSFTFGLFIDPKTLMNEKIYRKTFDFHKRPTGGGVLFHGWDVTFSCFVPKNHPGYCLDVLESYKYINDRIALALSEFLEKKEGGLHLLEKRVEPMDEACTHFCFAKPTIYDIMVGEKKVCGAAQRRKRNGYLHQGSIALVFPEKALLKPLFSKESNVLEAMNYFTHPVLGQKAHSNDKKGVAETIKRNIVCALNQ